MCQSWSLWAFGVNLSVTNTCHWLRHRLSRWFGEFHQTASIISIQRCVRADFASNIHTEFACCCWTSSKHFFAWRCHHCVFNSAIINMTLSNLFGIFFWISSFNLYRLRFQGRNQYPAKSKIRTFSAFRFKVITWRKKTVQNVYSKKSYTFFADECCLALRSVPAIRYGNDSRSARSTGCKINATFLQIFHAPQFFFLQKNATHVNFTNSVTNQLSHDEWRNSLTHTTDTGEVIIGSRLPHAPQKVQLNFWCTFPLNINVSLQFFPKIL